MSLDGIVSRRDFLRVAGPAIAIPLAIDSLEAQRKVLPTISNVRNGLISPDQYFNYQLSEIPEAAKAKSSGMLQGILFNPSDQELRTDLRRAYQQRTSSELDLNRIINSDIEGYRNVLRIGGLATVTGSDAGLIGNPIARYILVNGAILKSPKIQKDADVQSALRHELEHINDFYNGVQFGRVILSSNNADNFSPEFFGALSELRATYTELREIYRKMLQSGLPLGSGFPSEKVLPVSRVYFETKIFEYVVCLINLEKSAKNSFEKEVHGLQFRAFRDIWFDYKDANSINFHLDLFGTKYSVPITLK